MSKQRIEVVAHELAKGHVIVNEFYFEGDMADRYRVLSVKQSPTIDDVTATYTYTVKVRDLLDRTTRTFLFDEEDEITIEV